ncbi:MAG: CDP-alcohol phosphatidyltransferase family protein [Actinomycetota bacterium]|jgi:CDP-diacylglycerol---glycerol-3-phosphate 3-phosphatidyltransferase
MTIDDGRRRSREAPRVRDMPAPRKSEGAAGGAAQRIFAWPYRGVLAFLLWTGVSPNQLTVLALAANVVSGVLILAGDWLWAAVALILGGIFDVMDGSVARQRGESRRSGAFMDSVLDRISDMVLFSCLFWRLAADGQTVAAFLALVTLVVSVAVSHVRAEAEAAKVVLTEGLFQRLERVIALAVGLLIPGMMLPVLVLLAVLGSATVLQRSFLAVRGA